MSDQGSDLPTTPQRLMETLTQIGVDFELHHHQAVHSVSESTNLKQHIPGTHCRNLFVRDKKKNMFLIVLSNNTQVDLKHLETILECGRLSFGSADRLWQYLGVKPGSVCPFAAINNTDHSVKIILDKDMMQSDRVNYHPLLNTMTIGLSPNHLLRFFDYTEHKPQILNVKS